MFGVKLQESGFLDDIDAIVPIPLHPKRQRKRGYNQSQKIAEGISNITKTPIIADAIIRKIHTNTQTRKNKEERAENVQGIFEVINDKAFENKNILILDDVITTGATCISCAEMILQNSNVKSISFASVALAN